MPSALMDQRSNASTRQRGVGTGRLCLHCSSENGQELGLIPATKNYTGVRLPCLLNEKTLLDEEAGRKRLRLLRFGTIVAPFKCKAAKYLTTACSISFHVLKSFCFQSHRLTVSFKGFCLTVIH